MIILGIRFLFSLFSGGVSSKSSSNQSKASIEQFLDALMKVSSHVMKEKQENYAKKSELEILKRFLDRNFNVEQNNYALKKLQQYLGYNYSLNEIFSSCSILRLYDYSTKIFVMNICFSLASADGVIDEKENRLLYQIANWLHINQNDFINLNRRFNNLNSRYEDYSQNYSFGKNISSHYKTLGVTEKSSDQEIKKAYREKAKLFHPDKYANRSEAERKNAEAKFKEINNAYEEICKEKNIK
jgi:DnaJ like chaperone protein